MADQARKYAKSSHARGVNSRAAHLRGPVDPASVILRNDVSMRDDLAEVAATASRFVVQQRIMQTRRLNGRKAVVA